MNVGIDLGTTNSALAYVDPSEAAESDAPPIHVLPIEQQVDSSRTAALKTLPSFLYLSEPPVVGTYAREQGALTPTKTVHSAKSWLSNSEADRTAKTSSLGFTGGRPRAFASGSLHPLSRSPLQRLAERKGLFSRGPTSGPHGASQL